MALPDIYTGDRKGRGNLEGKTMSNIKTPAASFVALALVGAGLPAAAQQQPVEVAAEASQSILVEGQVPADISDLPDGPDIEGIISDRLGSAMEVTTPAGQATMVGLSQGTSIKGRGGFLGLGRTEVTGDMLLAGLPVEIETVQWGGGLLAKRVRFSNSDLETAQMIRGGTAGQFARQGAAIEANTEAAEALRGRMGEIDNYDIVGVTNVYFDTGEWSLPGTAERELCAAAMQADSIDNSLLLVVGYTDSVGDEDYNQVLSERRASRVVNTLQQKCSWKPWRMLSPTGMAESDPTADNSTAAGRAQNRRVSVNILVSKAAQGL